MECMKEKVRGILNDLPYNTDRSFQWMAYSTQGEIVVVPQFLWWGNIYLLEKFHDIPSVKILARTYDILPSDVKCDIPHDPIESNIKYYEMFFRDLPEIRSILESRRKEECSRRNKLLSSLEV